MSGNRERGNIIRRTILEAVSHCDPNLVSNICDTFEISRQATNKHIQKLISEGSIIADGKTRNRKYRLASLGGVKEFVVPLNKKTEEFGVWNEQFAPLIGKQKENIDDIWHYGFTEMLNNAIDHSGGNSARIIIIGTAIGFSVFIQDNGEGIFKKIMRELHLEDERHSVLELAKGKLTTDPDNHTGEGIFFTSRMMDYFSIRSGDVYFSHDTYEQHDWIQENNIVQEGGTTVLMELANDSSKKIEDIFESFTSDEDFGFTETVVPVRLAKIGDEKLISRSQAKRLLARFEKFKTVILEFDDIPSVGQAFADEIFRVFPKHHPNTKIIYVGANKSVERMITRALTHEK